VYEGMPVFLILDNSISLHLNQPSWIYGKLVQTMMKSRCRN